MLYHSKNYIGKKSILFRLEIMQEKYLHKR